MTANSIRNALGLLQDDPDHEQAYLDLKEALGSGAPEGMSPEDARSLLAQARQAHEARREPDAVASLLELEVLLAQGNGSELDLLRELARVSDEELFDDTRAEEVYGRVLALAPGDETVEEALERTRAMRAKWNDLVAKYVDEAKSATEPRIKASFLVSAAETAYRYGRAALASEKGAKKRLAALQNETIARLEEALEVEPKRANARARSSSASTASRAAGKISQSSSRSFRPKPPPKTTRPPASCDSHASSRRRSKARSARSLHTSA